MLSSFKNKKVWKLCESDPGRWQICSGRRFPGCPVATGIQLILDNFSQVYTLGNT